MGTEKLVKSNEFQTISVSFKILDIKLIKFAFESDSEIEEENIKDDFTFEINFRYDINFEKKTVNTYVFTKIYSDQDKKVFLGQIETKMEFLLINFDEIVIQENSQKKVMNLALNIFISVSISTARGMLASKTSGTPLEKAYLPVINTNDILNTLSLAEKD